MRDLFVYLFWAWCLVSVVILVYRRMSTPKSKPAPISSAGVASAGAASTEPVAPSTAAVEPAARPVPPPPAPVSPPPTATPAPTTTAVAAMAAGMPLSDTADLTTALAGIELPCDLAPLIGTGDIDPRELVLVTENRPPQIVGTAMGDELDRLGYSFTPLSDTALLAQRDDAAIELTLFSHATARDEAGNRLFPTAPTDSLVVRLRLR